MNKFFITLWIHFVIDLHWFDLGGCESLPDSSDIHSRTDPTVQRAEDRRTASSHLCNRRQCLSQHATIQTGPVYHHQVNNQCKQPLSLSLSLWSLLCLLFLVHLLIGMKDGGGMRNSDISQ